MGWADGLPLRSLATTAITPENLPTHSTDALGSSSSPGQVPVGDMSEANEREQDQHTRQGSHAQHDNGVRYLSI
jgi:hypothetical protein